MRTLLRHVFVILFLLLAACSYSQTTGYSGTGGNIDVNYHRFVWTLDAATKSVSGTVTTYFTTKQSNVSQITFDFTKASFNNASLVVKYHGSSVGVGVSFPSSGNVNILQITLPVTLPINKLDSVSITYAGTPPLFSTYGEGMDQGNITGLGNALYTLAESYGDDDFWPCKADMQDKIDSIDFIITTPSTQMAAANGVLISNVTSGGNRTVTYKHRYPIASYLVAVAVAQYSVYNRTPVDINGTSVPIVYYIGSSRTPTTANFTTMDYCRDDLVAFSNVFGDYPFKNEKYGMYEFGWGGGMEHQTFSAMNWSSMISWSVVAHELAHQWFGDKVTFGTWNHLWLAEGFARYCEALAAELVPAMGKNASTVRSGFKSTANNTTNRGFGCYIPNASIVNSNTIWNSAYGTTVYERGAMVVSMLRKLMGDTKFFQACRNYLSDPVLAYNSATTDDFKNHCAAVLGYNLDAFFNDFVGSASTGGSGYPTYTVNWGNNGKRINIELTTQTRTSATTSYFRTPVVLRISNASTDTTVVIYDQNGIVSYAGNGILKTISGKRVGYNLSFVPTSISFDPDNETLATGSASFNAALNNVSITLLDVKIVDFKGTEREDGNLLSLSIAPTSDKATLTLERSEDGIHFSAIGEMENEISTASGISYTFLDTKVLEGITYYYRVKAADDKGQIVYSKTINLLKQDSRSEINISPNPANNYIRISLPVNWHNKRIDYTIYSNNGAVIQKERVIAGADIKIALGNTSSGNYTIELNSDHGKLSKGFIVIH